MPNRPRGGDDASSVRATYYPSRVPGIYCALLADDGPPRVRIHDRLVLLAVTSGEVTVTCRGEIHALRPGRLLMVEPGEVHRDLRKTPYRAAMVLLRAELVHALRGRDLGPWLGPVVVESRPLCAEVVALVESVRDGREQAIQERHAAGLFRGLAPLWTRVASRVEPALVVRVRRLFEESPEAALSLDELARRLGCAPSHLCRVFAEHVGVGPAAYQLQRRLLQARSLVESGQTIASAAALTGFNDESHLRRHFRRRFAAPPGRYKHDLDGTILHHDDQD